MVLGSRALSQGVLKGGMPVHKYISNRFLTSPRTCFWERRYPKKLPLLENSNDFVFDNQMLAQAAFFGFRIGEISCPTKYFTDAPR